MNLKKNKKLLMILGGIVVVANDQGEYGTGRSD